MPIDKFSGQWIPTQPFDREEALSLEHRKQKHRFVHGAGVPFDDAADRRQRAYAQFKAWHHKQQVAYVEELKREGKDAPTSQDPSPKDEVNEDDEQDSTHYWSRYPPD
jgi:hypothetical protein